MSSTPKFIVREMREEDLEKGFFSALSNLTEVGEIANKLQKARKLFREITSNPSHRIFVAVTADGDVIGSTTLLIEQKFIHNGGRVGHIEDVVVRHQYWRHTIGSTLVQHALTFAKKKNCYKVTLYCSDKNIQFYTKLGFKKHSVNMRYDIK